MRDIYILSVAVLFLGVFTAVSGASIACTDLSNNLSYGSSDKTSKGEVTILQNYLYARGYLKATPNGHFGPATLRAVKALQANNGVSAVGIVGPITRSLIKRYSCLYYSNTASAVNALPTPTNIQTRTPPAPVVTPAQNTTPSIQTLITSPSSGEELKIGANYTIVWSGNPGNNYSILLEDQNGVGKGYIASNLSQGSSYVWKVGDVVSGGDPVNYLGNTGNKFRIHIMPMNSYSSGDMFSGLFTMVAEPISITGIIPNSVKAGTNSSIVIFGSGFTNQTSVSFNGNGGTYPSYRTTISLDNKMIMVSTPADMPVGQYGIVINNSYNSYWSAPMLTVTN